MSTAPHARILAAAARAALKPLGVQQVGRSRVWRDDRRWYVILIEFQPSGFAKGSHLNVGVSWLHYEKPHLSFDVGYREKAFVEDRNDEQFTPACTRECERERRRVGRAWRF